jgi:tetratricopeptide (TPR) repeat protein
MKHHFIISISLIAGFVSCQVPNRKAAMRIANKAISIYYTNTLNIDSTNKALHLLDSSIKLYPDPTFYLFKYQIYRSTNRQLAALHICDTVLIIDGNNYLTTLGKGYIFEKMGKSDSAIHYYKAALRIVDNWKPLEAPAILQDHERIVITALLKDTGAFNRQVAAFRAKYRSSNGDLFEAYTKEFDHFRRDDYVETGSYVERDSVQAIQDSTQ